MENEQQCLEIIVKNACQDDVDASTTLTKSAVCEPAASLILMFKRISSVNVDGNFNHSVVNTVKSLELKRIRIHSTISLRCSGPTYISKCNTYARKPRRPHLRLTFHKIWEVGMVW
jgi:hypothetical protein